MANNSVRGMMIETRRGLVVLDPAGMPVNLGRAGYEDNPESAIPAVPFAARNVLPTPLGYKSAFRPGPMFNAFGDENPALDKILFQDIFAYQTIKMDNILVGLAEGGLFLYDHGPSPHTSGGTTLIDKWTMVEVVAEVSGARTQWTRCVLDNKLYAYHQGNNEVFVFCDFGEYMEGLAAGGRGIWQSVEYQFGLIAFKPSFLNMEGQVGIFKADNRLGMWDTDGSIAWSSALDKMDFTPDVTTFAGVTKFSTVTGNITAIHQHGRGFIIYATRSITLAIPATSQERWTGMPVTSALGVLYDTQIALGQPDTTHYCWTSAGLYVIENGNATPYEPEVSNYLASQAPLIQLRMINSSHLFLQISEADVKDSGASRYARLTFDGRGTPLVVNATFNTTDPEYEKSKRWPYTTLYGTEGRDPFLSLLDFEPEPDPVPMPDPKKEEALIPCYSGWKFIMPSGLDTPEDLKWDPASTEAIPTGGWPAIPGWSFPRDNPVYQFTSGTARKDLKPDSKFFSYEAGPIVSPPGARFIDSAGQEFIDIMIESLGLTTRLAMRFKTLMEAKISAGTDLSPPSELDDTVYMRLILAVIPTPSNNYPYPVPDRPNPYPIQTMPFAGVVIPNVIVSTSYEVEEDGCVLKITAEVADFIGGNPITGECLEERTEPDPDHPGHYRYDSYNELIYKFKLEVLGGLEEVPDTRKRITLFQAEITGFGYYPQGGFSFRKTHRRSNFKPCDPTDTYKSTFVPAQVINELDAFNGAYKLTDPVYQDGLPSTDTPYETYTPGFSYYTLSSEPGYPNTSPAYANFGKGIFAPYYPFFSHAFVKDLQLEKWGVYSNSHRLLFEVLPANRTESMKPVSQGYSFGINAGVIPNFGTEDDTQYPSLTSLSGKPCFLLDTNTDSVIHYGRIGLVRAGFTRVVGGSFQVSPTPTTNQDYNYCNITVAGSLTNSELVVAQQGSPGNSVSFTLTTPGQAEVPFALEGRWYTIALRGSFDIKGLTLYGKPSGRLRFPLGQAVPT